MNTSVSDLKGTSTILFRESAQNNIVRYCNIKGSESTISSGVIFFSFASIGTGNNNNTIDNNNISCQTEDKRPVNIIYSSGQRSRGNNKNTISNNNIYNFLNQKAESNGVYISTYSSAWTITGQ